MRTPAFFLFLSIASGSITSLLGGGHIDQIDAPDAPLALYQKSEWQIVAHTRWRSSPHLSSDVALDMALVSPSGREMILPCFYSEGGSGEQSKWIARFAPQETGHYRYQFRLIESGEIVSESGVSSFASTSSNNKGFLHPHNLWSFKFDNGEIFRGLGYNIGWESRATDDSKFFKDLHENPRFNYEEMLDRLVQGGGNFFRTWMVYWNLPLDWKKPRNSHRYEASEAFFNESGAKRLEYLIELSKERDLYFMLALDTHVALTGDGWKRSKYNAANGGPAETPAEFFTSETAKEWYKSKLRYMVARFGYSPNIAVWEFFNEVDNAMYPKSSHKNIPSEAVADWHREMSEFLKETDPYGHLISTSISHREVDGMNHLLAMDFNQKHVYRNTQSIPLTLSESSASYQKPFVIGEFAYEWDWSKNFDDFSEEMDSDFKRGLWFGLFSPTPILPMSWWWEYFDQRNTNQYLNSVAKIRDLMLEHGQARFERLAVSADQGSVATMAVQVGEKIFVYLYNSTENSMKLDVSISRSAEVLHPRSLVGYHCEQSRFFDVEQTPNVAKDSIALRNLSLPAETDYVLILSQE